MKKLLLSGLAAAIAAPVFAEVSEKVVVQDRECTLITLQTRQIGPGSTYYRYRVPEFPLNINMVRVDLTNPYIRIETSIPNNLSAGTELLVDAAARYDAKDHHAICAQNSNFWIVTTQPQWAAYNASTHNISLRNGMLSIDSRSFPHWWWWDTTRSGIVSVSNDNKVFIDACRTEQTISSSKFGTRDFTNCNKGFKTGQTSIYTPYFGPDRQFLPLLDDTPEQLANNDIHYDIDENSQCTEVLLKLNEGETWMGGRDIAFTVAEIRHSNGRGTLGNYDLAIVSRESYLDQLAVGDDLKLNYSWVFDPDGQAIKPLIEQAVGGNMLVMRHGQITEQNYWDSYNTMVYSRSAYGISEDGNTLYMLTIDKSQDLTYGNSVGCTTADMCDIVRHLGVWNLVNVDAGGSAELMVDGGIINVTTEGKPRAVGNGWMVFNTAPDDETEVAALAFYDVELTAPAGAKFTPRVIAFNRYGTVIDNDFKDYTISADPTVGTGSGNVLQTVGEPVSGPVTIFAGDGISATKQLTLVTATPSLKRATVVLDMKHSYPIEITATVGKTDFEFNPALVKWTSDRPDVAYVDETGTIQALANGTATINGKLFDMDQSLAVSVENALFPTLPITEKWTDWTPRSASGIKNLTVGEDGTLSYTYSSVRGRSWVSLTKATDIYGCPLRVVAEMENSMPVTEVELDLHAYGNDRDKVSYIPEAEIPAGTTFTATFEVADLGDTTDSRTYPLSMSTIKVYSPSGSAYKGDHTLKIKNLYAEYNSDGGVDNVTADDRGLMLFPNPAEASQPFSVTAASSISAVQIYDLAGRLVSSTDVDNLTHVTVAAPAIAGTYIVRALTATSATATRLIVR